MYNYSSVDYSAANTNACIGIEAENKQPRRNSESTASKACIYTNERYNVEQWRIALHPKALKSAKAISKQAHKALALLLREIELNGPVRGNWPNYCKLVGGKHHCHLKNGKPTYVAVWEVKDAAQRQVEVSYVGTRENAPY